MPYHTDDILDRLKFWRELPTGAPLPEEVAENCGTNVWADLIRAVCGDAVTEIEELRARVATLVIFTGAATSGPDLREIKDGQARDALR